MIRSILLNLLFLLYSFVLFAQEGTVTGITASEQNSADLIQENCQALPSSTNLSTRYHKLNHCVRSLESYRPNDGSPINIALNYLAKWSQAAQNQSQLLSSAQKSNPSWLSSQTRFNQSAIKLVTAFKMLESINESLDSQIILALDSEEFIQALKGLKVNMDGLNNEMATIGSQNLQQKYYQNHLKTAIRFLTNGIEDYYEEAIDGFESVDEVQASTTARRKRAARAALKKIRILINNSDEGTSLQNQVQRLTINPNTNDEYSRMKGILLRYTAMPESGDIEGYEEAIRKTTQVKVGMVVLDHLLGELK